MGNLKSAPLPLTPALAAKLAGDRPALGKGINHLPIAGIVNGPAEPELPLRDGGPITASRNEGAIE